MAEQPQNPDAPAPRQPLPRAPGPKKRMNGCLVALLVMFGLLAALFLLIVGICAHR